VRLDPLGLFIYLTYMTLLKFPPSPNTFHNLPLKPPYKPDNFSKIGDKQMLTLMHWIFCTSCKPETPQCSINIHDSKSEEYFTTSRFEKKCEAIVLRDEYPSKIENHNLGLEIVSIILPLAGRSQSESKKMITVVDRRIYLQATLVTHGWILGFVISGLGLDWMETIR